jgi:hypothetical protein
MYSEYMCVGTRTSQLHQPSFWIYRGKFRALPFEPRLIAKYTTMQRAHAGYFYIFLMAPDKFQRKKVHSKFKVDKGNVLYGDLSKGFLR